MGAGESPDDKTMLTLILLLIVMFGGTTGDVSPIDRGVIFEPCPPGAACDTAPPSELPGGRSHRVAPLNQKGTTWMRGRVIVATPEDTFASI